MRLDFQYLIDCDASRQLMDGWTEMMTMMLPYLPTDLLLQIRSHWTAKRFSNRFLENKDLHGSVVSLFHSSRGFKRELMIDSVEETRHVLF
jgi:hypothetical protein